MITKTMMQPYRDGTIGEAEVLGIPEIDEYFRFKKEFILIGGLASTGKTYAWMYLAFTMAMMHPDKPKFLFFCNENTVPETALIFLEWYNQKWITDQSDVEVSNGIEWLNRQFLFMEENHNVDVKSLLNMFYLIKTGQDRDEYTGLKNPYGKFEFDSCFIDPYSSLNAYGGYSDHYKNASLFRKAVATLDAQVVVTMHATTGAARARIPDTDLIKTPTINDIEYGVLFNNRADTSMIIHRHTMDAELRQTTFIHVNKVKVQRTGGKPTNTEFPITLVWSKFLAGRFKFEDSGNCVPVNPTIEASKINHKIEPQIDFDKEK